MSSTEKRPAIESIKSSAEFERWYWLKAELLDYCRHHRLGTVGQKRELAARIVQYLDTGTVVKPRSKKVASTFDWGKEPLKLSTIITDSYRNSSNMRKFMKAQAGEHFKFSNEFMEWMRNNEGKTLKDAVKFWQALDQKKRKAGYREKPLPQNQYNAFTRALSEVRPGITAKEMRRLWAIKRSKPGPHTYEPGDENQ